MTPRLSAIKIALDDKYPIDTHHNPFQLVGIVQSLVNVFSLQPAEMDELVEMTAVKLQEVMLHDNYDKSF